MQLISEGMSEKSTFEHKKLYGLKLRNIVKMSKYYTKYEL